MKQFTRKYILFAAPFVLGFLAVYIVPFVYSVYYSVIRSSFDHSFVGLGNYISVLSNSYFLLALRNTAWFVFTAMPALVLYALLIALLLTEGGPLAKRGLEAFVLPMLLPSVSVIYIFRMLFKARGGVLAPFFAALGASEGSMPLLSIYAIYFWKNLGLNLILLTGAIKMIPREQYEAAMLDGASNVKKHLSITLPQITPALFFSVVLSIVYALRVFRETYLLYGAYPDKSVYFMQHYMNNHFYKLNYQNLTASAMIFAVMIYAVLAVCFALERKFYERRE